MYTDADGLKPTRGKTIVRIHLANRKSYPYLCAVTNVYEHLFANT